jgi:hypothetical protein
VFGGCGRGEALEEGLNTIIAVLAEKLLEVFCGAIE